MTDGEKYELLKAYVQGQLSEDFVRSALIRDQLETNLSINPLNAKNDYDLNPHLTLEKICQDVAHKVFCFGISCSKEDVMLFWLTTIIYSDDKGKWL